MYIVFNVNNVHSYQIGVTSYRIRSNINVNILKTLYYALIYPHLSYAIESWGTADNTHINKLLTLQKRIVRMITISDRRHDDYSFPQSNPLFKQLGFLKVHDIFKLRISNFVFKCLNRTSPMLFHSWFITTSSIHQHNTRSKFSSIDESLDTRTLFIRSVRSTRYGLKQTKVSGAKLWNQLPPILRRDDLTIYSFTKELKKFFITQYI